MNAGAGGSCVCSRRIRAALFCGAAAVLMLFLWQRLVDSAAWAVQLQHMLWEIALEECFADCVPFEMPQQMPHFGCI